MSTFEEQARVERDRAANVANARRARSEAVDILFSIVGKTCKTEADQADAIAKLTALRYDNAITDDELQRYKASVTVAPDKLTAKVVKPLEGRAKIAADNAKIKTDVDKMSDAEFADAWRNA